VNQDVLGHRAMSEYEQFSFKGWNDETVYGYVMKPFGFTAGKKYPVTFVIHGGPQASFGNAWSYRWSPQAWAGHGYGVVFIDFHGSPGYGQAFTDSISGTGVASRSKTCRRVSPQHSRNTTGSTAATPAPPAHPTAAHDQLDRRQTGRIASSAS